MTFLCLITARKNQARRVASRIPRGISWSYPIWAMPAVSWLLAVDGYFWGLEETKKQVSRKWVKTMYPPWALECLFKGGTYKIGLDPQLKKNALWPLEVAHSFFETGEKHFSLRTLGLRYRSAQESRHATKFQTTLTTKAPWMKVSRLALFYHIRIGTYDLEAR